MSISKDSSTSLSKGFGFVKYMSKESADKAKATLNGTPLKDFPELKASVRFRPRDLPAHAGCGSCGADLNWASGGCRTESARVCLHDMDCFIKTAVSRLVPSTTVSWSAVQVRVLPSQAKNRLYVGNIPKSLSHEQLVDTLKPLTKGAPAAASMTLSQLACPC